MVKKTFPIIVFFVLGAGLLLFQKQLTKIPSLPETTPITLSSPTPTAEIADYRGSFAIFTNGTFRVFTAAMYHNLSPDVYITANNPNIVYVKKAKLTWNDFFQTLPIKLSKDCLTTGTGQTFCTDKNGVLKFYINGLLTNDLLEKIINAGDQVLISYGNENDSQIQKQLERVPKLE